jgi:hypothetical protein
MLVRNTLTEARPLRDRPGAVGLVLSLEGARYYIFHSRQTRDQVASSMTRTKIDLHQELAARFNQPVIPNNQRQAEYLRLAPAVRAAAATTAMDPAGRHAEEMMIENWDACVHDFQRHRGRAPLTAEVFLSYCPCQPTNNAPSPRRTFNGIVYPVSCSEKLKVFCRHRLGMKWTVYYDHPFQNIAALNITIHNLRIMTRPAHIPYL